jgi:hypothetical protein
MILNDNNFKKKRLSLCGWVTQETLVSKLQPEIDHHLPELRRYHGQTEAQV